MEPKTWDLRHCQTPADLEAASGKVIDEIVTEKLAELRQSLLERGFSAAAVDRIIERNRRELEAWRKEALRDLRRTVEH